MSETTFSGQQRRFVHFYTTDGRAVPTKAARLAGYATPEIAGHRLMKQPKVKRAIVVAFDAFAGDGLRNKQARIAALVRRAALIEQAIEARAAEYQRLGVTPLPTFDPEDDPAMQSLAKNVWLLEAIAPEALTGLYIRDVTVTASGSRVVKWVFDAAAMRELRELEKQLAIEVGDWTENKHIRAEVTFQHLQQLAVLADGED